jgi:hypothetical protein
VAAGVLGELEQALIMAKHAAAMVRANPRDIMILPNGKVVVVSHEF